MARRRISDERVRKLIDAYEQWNPGDPEAPSADGLAAEHGISKATMYRLLREHRAVKDADRLHVTHPSDRDKDPHPVSEKEAVGILLEALVEAKLRVKLLEEIMAKYRLPVPPPGAVVNVAELPPTLGELLNDSDGRGPQGRPSPYMKFGPTL